MTLSIRERLQNRIKDLKMNLSWHLNYPLITAETLTINLTRRCNLNCLFCFDYNKRRKLNEMSFNDIKKILFNAKRTGTKTFNIMGGEPFIRGDILEIIRYAQKLELNTTITTNGTLLSKEMIHRLIGFLKDDLFTIMLSLDGVEEFEHDFIRGKGTFKKTIRTIKDLGNEKKKQKKSFILGINTVINSKNIMHLNKITNLAEKFNVDFIQLITMVISPAAKRSIVENELYFKPKLFKLLDEQIEFFMKYKKMNNKVNIANDLKNLNNFKSYYRRQYETIKKCR